MKNLLKYTVVLLSMMMFTSCLKSGLDDLPAYEEAHITSFKFEYRWMGTNGDNDQLNVYQMNVVSTIDTLANTVDCVVNVPSATDTGAKPSDDFPTAIRDEVGLSNLVGYCSISNAATMKPIGDAPELGVLSDFSDADMQYEVVAADGTSVIWTLNITELNK